MMTDIAGAPVSLTSDPFNVWMGLDVKEDGIPHSLKCIDQWVLWKAEPKKSGIGMDKIPYQPNGQTASSTNPASWSDFYSVLSTYQEEEGVYDGIGITVQNTNGIVYLDFDHVRNAITGIIDDDVLEAIQYLESYAELSPSGTGIRIIGYGKIIDNRPSFTTKRLQAWSGSRFLTITGQRIEQSSSEIVTFQQEKLDSVFTWYDSQDPQRTPQKITSEAASTAYIYDGSRNRALTSLAGAMRRHGLSHAGLEAALLAENINRCKPPLDEKEVRRIARSVARYEPEGDVALGAAISAALLDSKTTYQPKESHGPELSIDLLEGAPGMIGKLLAWGLETAHKPLPHVTLQSAFATASAAASRRYRTNLNNWPSLWFLNTEVTASGKEHPESIIEIALEAAGLGRLLAGSGYTSPGAIFSVMMDRPAHIALIDEFGKLMQSSQAKGNQQKADAITLLMQIFSSCHRSIRPQAYSAMGLSKEQRRDLSDRVIQNPGVVLYASTTPSTFFDSIDRQWISDGFLGRFITCNSNVGRQLSRSVERIPFPETVAQWLAEIACRSSLGGDVAMTGVDSEPDQAPLAVDMRFAPDAERLLQAFEKDIHAKMNDAQRWGLDPLFGRTREKAMRLSMLVCLAEGAQNRTISASQVEYAVSYVMEMDSTLVEAAKLKISDSDFARIKNICLDHLRKSGSRGLTERELERACAQFNALKPTDQKTILAALQKSALIDHREISSSTGRGRKRSAWVALQDDDEQEAENTHE